MEVFSLYLAALVMFRVIFAVIYILNWKFKYTCFRRYRVQYHDLQAEFKRLKSGAANVHGESTDDEEMEEKVHTIFKTNEEKVRKKMHQRRDSRTGSETKHEVNIHDATIEFMHEENVENPEDSDDDYREFEDADIEEAEDRIYSEYKKRKQLGKGAR